MRLLHKDICFSICCTVLSCSVMSESLGANELQPTRLHCPWGFSRQECWSGFSCTPRGDLPNPGIKARSSALQMDSLPSEPPGKPIDIYLFKWLRSRKLTIQILQKIPVKEFSFTAGENVKWHSQLEKQFGY